MRIPARSGAEAKTFSVDEISIFPKVRASASDDGDDDLHIHAGLQFSDRFAPEFIDSLGRRLPISASLAPPLSFPALQSCEEEDSFSSIDGGGEFLNLDRKRMSQWRYRFGNSWSNWPATYLSQFSFFSSG